MTVNASERIALTREYTPGAVQLATMISLSVRAEPALLRAARRAAHLDAVAEADLWFSGLVASAGPLGVSLRPAVADLLRAELEPAHRESAWSLVLRHHGEEAWSIRLEELINYLDAGGEADVQPDELLAAALTKLRDSDEREARGIARWLLAALARLPEGMRESPTAAVAAVAAGAQLDGRIEGFDQLSASDREAWLPWLLHSIGSAELRVQLLPGTAATSSGPAGDERTLLLGGDVGAVIDVPATEPLVLTVSWADSGGPRTTEASLRTGETHAVEIAGRELTLRTIAGDEVVIEVAGVGRLNGSTGDIPACVVSPTLIAATAEALRPILPYSTFTPDDGAPIACRPQATVAAGVAYIELESAAPSVMRVTEPEVGATWVFADGRPGGGTIAGVEGADLTLAVAQPFEPEAGLIIALERPWGVGIGVVIDGASPSTTLQAAVIDLAAERSPLGGVTSSDDVVVDEAVLRCDVYLEGGITTAVGMVGALTLLEEQGFALQRIAGASAGALVGALLAAGYTAADTRESLLTLDYSKLLAKRGRIVRQVLGNARYSVGYLVEWMREQLARKGILTFADLRMDDPAGDLRMENPENYRFVVMVADLTQGKLARLPWAYLEYGLDPDEQLVAEAVSASISIPEVFEPFSLLHPNGKSSVLADSTSARTPSAASVFSNHPTEIFDRTDGAPPRWPTFGVRIVESEVAQIAQRSTATETVDLSVSPTRERIRTIAVPNLGVGATDFDLPRQRASTLYEAGRAAAEEFLESWSWGAYTEQFRFDNFSS